MPTRHSILVVVVGLLVSGAGVEGPQPGQAERGVESPLSPDENPASPTGSGTSDALRLALREALKRSVEDPTGGAPLDLQVECQTEEGYKSFQVFGSGIGIWNRRRQFEIPPQETTQLLRVLLEQDFPGLEEAYGGKHPRDSKSAAERSGSWQGPRLTCRVRLILGPLIKQAQQLAKGEQSAALKGLALALLQITEPLASSGVEASDLNDGFEKATRGELVAETVQVMLHRRPDRASGAPGNLGFLLRLDGATATARRYDRATGYGPSAELRLETAEFRELAGIIAGVRPAELPVNLYAPDYTDLTLSVLDQRKSVQARQFAGMPPATLGSHQEAFQTLVDALYELHLQVLERGAPTQEQAAGG